MCLVQSFGVDQFWLICLRQAVFRFSFSPSALEIRVDRNRTKVFVEQVETDTSEWTLIKNLPWQFYCNFLVTRFFFSHIFYSLSKITQPAYISSLRKSLSQLQRFVAAIDACFISTVKKYERNSGL